MAVPSRLWLFQKENEDGERELKAIFGNKEAAAVYLYSIPIGPTPDSAEQGQRIPRRDIEYEVLLVAADGTVSEIEDNIVDHNEGAARAEWRRWEASHRQREREYTLQRQAQDLLRTI